MNIVILQTQTPSTNITTRIRGCAQRLHQSVEQFTQTSCFTSCICRTLQGSMILQNGTCAQITLPSLCVPRLSSARSRKAHLSMSTTCQQRVAIGSHVHPCTSSVPRKVYRHCHAHSPTMSFCAESTSARHYLCINQGQQKAQQKRLA